MIALLTAHEHTNDRDYFMDVCVFCHSTKILVDLISRLAGGKVHIKDI